MRRRTESGFALLLVFVLAAIVAITLYTEMPRVAFESQRQREQLLISRGEQYQRAIQLFYRKYHTYPQNLDDLETTRNIRFLRRRYIDPMTGKSEWRLIHIGPGGMLTDSLVQPANPGSTDKDKDKDKTNASGGDATQAQGQGQGPQLDANGQPINQAAAFDFGTSGRAPGTYRIGLKVTADGFNDATAETAVTVRGYEPPSGSAQGFS